MGKISTKAETKWAKLENFHVGVSMGSRLHSGDYLAAIIEWINERAFKTGLIDISDTLNRYNYMIAGYSEKESLEKSRQDGVEWYQRNRYTLDKLQMPVQIVHWDTWLSDDKFQEYDSAFHQAYHKDPAFRLAVMKDVQHHYQRKFQQSLHERKEADVELSCKFYLEELAVLSIQFENYPCAELYPGREFECVKLVRAGKVKQVPAGLKNAVYAKLYVHESEDA